MDPRHRGWKCKDFRYDVRLVFSNQEAIQGSGSIFFLPRVVYLALQWPSL